MKQLVSKVQNHTLQKLELQADLAEDGDVSETLKVSFWCKSTVHCPGFPILFSLQNKCGLHFSGSSFIPKGEDRQ